MFDCLFKQINMLLKPVVLFLLIVCTAQWSYKVISMVEKEPKTLKNKVRNSSIYVCIT